MAFIGQHARNYLNCINKLLVWLSKYNKWWLRI